MLDNGQIRALKFCFFGDDGRWHVLNLDNFLPMHFVDDYTTRKLDDSDKLKAEIATLKTQVKEFKKGHYKAEFYKELYLKFQDKISLVLPRGQCKTLANETYEQVKAHWGQGDHKISETKREVENENTQV